MNAERIVVVRLTEQQVDALETLRDRLRSASVPLSLLGSSALVRAAMELGLRASPSALRKTVLNSSIRRGRKVQP